MIYYLVLENSGSNVQYIKIASTRSEAKKLIRQACSSTIDKNEHIQFISQPAESSGFFIKENENEFVFIHSTENSGLSYVFYGNYYEKILKKYEIMPIDGPARLSNDSIGEIDKQNSTNPFMAEIRMAIQKRRAAIE